MSTTFFHTKNGVTSPLVRDISGQLTASSYTNDGLTADQLTSVVIGTNVTSIGVHAFSGCSNLASVTIPDSVTSIGSNAFNSCSKLTSITIPYSVTSIDNFAFNGCSKLTSVTILYPVTSIETGTFQNCSVLSSFTIPDSVTSINNFAFKNTALTSVTIPDLVTSIGTGAFQGTALTSVTIPNSVTIINNFAFSNCSALTSVTIGNKVASIGNNAFINCSALTSVTIPDSVTSIGNAAFYNCSVLTFVTIPDSVTSIGTSAFSNCSALTSVTIEDASNITTIYSHSFTNVSGTIGSFIVFSNIADSNSFPSSTASTWQTIVGYYETAYYIPTIFYHTNTGVTNPVYVDISGDLTATSYTDAGLSAEDLTSVKISSNVTSIGNQAFQNCYDLSSVTIPDSVTSIGNYAFWNCDSLITLNLGSGVVTIGESAFENSAKLEEVIIPNNTISIGNYAFRNCGQLTTLNLGSGVVTIGESAFQDCAVLAEVIIPNSTISIGDYAFQNCGDLLTLNLGSGVETIGDNAFFDNGQLSSVIIPDSTRSIGDNAFLGCNKLTTLYLGSGVETIGNSAFLECVKLKTVTISDVSGITTISSNSFTDLSGTDSYSGSTITFTGYDSFIELDNVWIDNGLQSTWDAITSYFETQNPPKQIDPTLSNFSIPTLNITNTEPYTIIPPDSDSSGTFTYDSSNTNIVEISGNTIISENKTAGETTITATQEETRYYFTGSISAPVTNICFLAGTPVTTDQGNIPIEKINPKIHTIRNKKIVGITQTITQDKHLICFEKNSLGKNIPSQQTIITRNHRIFYKGKMIKACKFTDIKNVYEIKYNGEFLYNVLMEEHDKMIVNNFICETLDPKNDIAKLYRCFENKTKTQIEQMIQCYNKNVIKKNIFSKR